MEPIVFLGGSTVSAKTHFTWFAGTVVIAALLSTTVNGQTTTAKEYQLKAAFLFNFISFVDGDRFNLPPEEAKSDKPKPPIVIGIIGKDPFDNAFDLLKGKEVKDRPVTVKRFKSLEEYKGADGHIPEQHPDLAAIKACHVLFISPSEKDRLKNLINPLRTAGILTVADVPGFLEAGGMINFVIEDNKVRFDVNSAATARGKLEIRSKLLRLARNVKNDALEGPANDGGPAQTEPK
jgi:hypothetical protein